MRTIFFRNRPTITATSSIAGPKECSGSIGKFIQTKLSDDMYGEKTFEKAESRMLFTSIKNSIINAGKNESDVDAIISGDLLDQIIASTFSARNFDTGYLGVYNACATFAEALTLGATLIDGNYMNNVVCAASSHANNMGAAMAPAALNTLLTLFNDTKTNPEDYDLIVSGDLGTLGSRILKDLIWEKGFDIEKQHVDCGELVYNIAEQEYQGGSGAGCSALVFSSYLFDKLKKGKVSRV